MKLPELTRVELGGRRFYDTPSGRVPSVTTILSATKDDSGLAAWRERVGEHEARRIASEASERGTEMHGRIACWMAIRESMLPSDTLPAKMADSIIERISARIGKDVGVEIGLYYPGEYAGTCDLICELDDEWSIIDFKQTNRPKLEEWVEDYKLQLVDYALAFNALFNQDIRTGSILMCSVGLELQEFRVAGPDFDQYAAKWWKRVEKFKQNSILTA